MGATFDSNGYRRPRARDAGRPEPRSEWGGARPARHAPRGDSLLAPRWQRLGGRSAAGNATVAAAAAVADTAEFVHDETVVAGLCWLSYPFGVVRGQWGQLCRITRPTIADDKGGGHASSAEPFLAVVPLDAIGRARAPADDELANGNVGVVSWAEVAKFFSTTAIGAQQAVMSTRTICDMSCYAPKEQGVGV